MTAVALAERRAPAPIVELLSAVSREDLLAEPELGLLLAIAWFKLGQYREARSLVDELAEHSKRRGNDQFYRRHLNLVGNLYFQHGDIAAAEAAYGEVFQRAVAVGDVQWVAFSTRSMGAVAAMKGDWFEALAASQRAVTALQHLGDDYNLAGAHQNLGMIFHSLGLLSESESHFEEATRLFETTGLDVAIELANVEAERALSISSSGDHRRAEATVRRAQERMENLVLQGHPLTVERAEAFRVLGIVLLRRGLLREAREELERALKAARAEKVPLLEAEVSEAMASLAHEEGQPREASNWAREAIRIYETMGAGARADRVLLTSLV